MRYTVILEQEEDGGYVASVSALPGCVSQGDNRGEALGHIREAIKLYLEDCIDAGEQIPVEDAREFNDTDAA
jgi:antitoxin HicB